MKKIFLLSNITISLALCMISCSNYTSSDQFQTNDPSAPFNLFHLFDGYPALKAAWDSVPGNIGNHKMTQMLKDDIPVGAELMHIISYLLSRADDPGLMLIEDLKATVGLVNDTSNRLYGHSTDNTGNPIGSFFATDSPETLVENTYSMIDEITTSTNGDTPKMTTSMMNITQKILSYVLTKSDDDIDKTVNDLMDNLKDPNFRNDFADVMDILAPMVSMADYPMFIDNKGTAAAADDDLITDYSEMYAHGNIINSDLGNSARGFNYLLSGVLDLFYGDTINRTMMYSIINGLNNALADPETTKKLMWNLSNYFVEGGRVYGSLDESNGNPDTAVYNTASNKLYSNVELGDMVRDLLAGAGGLLLRDDRPGSFGYHAGITSTAYPLAETLRNIKNVYINWDQAQIKESIYDMIRFDQFGRDRRTDPSAYSAGIFEHLLYLGAVASNYGFEHKANTNEVTLDAIWDPQNTVSREHGHGKHVGYLTLNDVLFSMQSKKDPLVGVGSFDLLFDSKNNYITTGHNNVFRSRISFSNGDRAKYKFAYSPNYPVLRMLSGPCPGDLGVEASLNGGNVGGNGGDVADGFIPYSPKGVVAKDLCSWTFGWVIRACWKGEGPYYFKDPDAQTATINGHTGKKYLRPDGRVYALVHGDTYYYPAEGTDDADEDGDGQRENRFYESWNTDYYMIEGTYDGKFYVPVDAGNFAAQESTTGPKARSYTELINPNNATRWASRGCASQEEAIFRNYQWIVNEKKMVMVVPLSLQAYDVNVGCAMVNSILSSLGYATVDCGDAANLLGIHADIEGAVYQIIEGNGISGMSNARIYRANNTWAKANTTAESSVPGDYRITVLAKPIRSALSLWGLHIDMSALDQLNAAKVYDDTLGRGSSTPGLVSNCFPALSRFAFPRSRKVTSGNDYEHYLLGSQNIVNPDINNGTVDGGFSTTDTVWKKRNSILPIFIALLAPIHSRSYYNSASDYNNAFAKMPESLDVLIKPLIYFNFNAGGSTFDGVAQNCWIPRIKGFGVPAPANVDDANNDGFEDEYLPTHSRYLCSDWDIFKRQWTNGSIPETQKWHGSWAAVNYYAPADIPSLLSVLTDSDTSPNRANRDQRADGFLSKMVEYDVTKGIGRPEVTETPARYSEPNMETINKICYGLEQLTTSMKHAEGGATKINRRLSDSTLADTMVPSDDPIFKQFGPLKQLAPPKWRFHLRQRPHESTKYIDMDFDDLLAKMIGENADEGLREYNQGGTAYASGAAVWDDMEDTISDLSDLTIKFLCKGAEYGIAENLFDIIDVMAQHHLTADQVKGMQYMLAKLLAHYDDDAFFSTNHRWVIQGEDGFKMLYNMLSVVLPNIDTEMGLYSADRGITKAESYRNLLTAMKNTTKEGGFVPWILDTVSASPYGSGDVLKDLEAWLSGDLISGPNTRFYSTLAEMLHDMSVIIGKSPTEEGLTEVYEYYGLQRN